MRQVLLTVQMAGSELADMRLLLHSLTTHLPAHLATSAADRSHEYMSEVQASQGPGHSRQMRTEQGQTAEQSPNKMAVSGPLSSEQAQTSPGALERLQQTAAKWKSRCHDLQREMAGQSIDAAAKNAALQVVLSMLSVLSNMQIHNCLVFSILIFLPDLLHSSMAPKLVRLEEC